MPTLLLKIKRQDDPMDLPYWEIFEVSTAPGMTVADALATIRSRPVTGDGNPTTPVLWDHSCGEGLCGSCTMIVNGRVRQACRVGLDEFDGPVTLEPLSKFPVVRDLRVDRDTMLEAVVKHSCWTGADGLAPREGRVEHDVEEERFSVYLDCVLCGACSEACPQVNARSAFAGAFVFSHVLPLNRAQAGRELAPQRLSALAGRGGVADCSGAENCERACPRGIPLVKGSAVLSWDVAVSTLARFFRE
ncbi:MAG: 4Fe-4S dicluster domain-containing protein [Proteobacteria bacterium]|nr:4Fe-4S dicluster domain-containing protein [Pseudomonadota bacterium]